MNDKVTQALECLDLLVCTIGDDARLQLARKLLLEVTLQDTWECACCDSAEPLIVREVR